MENKDSKKPHLVHLKGKPESWYATRANKSSATAFANKLNREHGEKKYEVSPQHWGNEEKSTPHGIKPNIDWYKKGGKISTAEQKNPKHKDCW
jgi:hypothetical protein